MEVHWIGSTHKKDEWIAADSLTTLDEGAEDTDVPQLECYSPFNIHEELAYRIKAALTSGTKDSVEVKIELPFDPIIYTGGLQQQGKFLRRWERNNIYGIKKYSDLIPLLGEKWHIRILNEHMNFCYVNLETVSFYLRRKQSLIEYSPDGVKQEFHGGFYLVFRFVRMDGVRRQLASVLQETE